MSLVRTVAKRVLPPLIADGVRSLIRGRMKQSPAQWYEVRSGTLQGSWLFLSLADEYTHRMLNGTYEAPFAEAMVARVQPGWVCFDVGAHLGYYSLLLAKLTGPQGQVHAFEPLAYNFEFIHRHLERNRQTEVVRLHPFALAEADGTSELYASNTLAASSMAFLKGVRTLDAPWYRDQYAHFTSVTVEQRSIDQLVTSHSIPLPHLIKIDVEGAELAVLRGALETMCQAKPIVVAELHTAANSAECVSLLMKAGYQVRVLVDVKADWCQILAE